MKNKILSIATLTFVLVSSAYAGSGDTKIKPITAKLIKPIQITTAVDNSLSPPSKEAVVNPAVKSEKKVNNQLPEAQIFYVNTDAEIEAVISSVEANRITLDGEKIVNVVNKDLSTFNYKNDPNTGDFF